MEDSFFTRLNTLQNQQRLALVLYTLLILWGILTFFLFPINVSVTWPVAQSLVFIVVTALAHATVFWSTNRGDRHLVYMAADSVVFLAFIGAVASYFLSPSSTGMPLVATWSMVGALLIHAHRLVLFVWGMDVYQTNM